MILGMTMADRSGKPEVGGRKGSISDEGSRKVFRISPL
jgi:hypothetical protein